MASCTGCEAKSATECPLRMSDARAFTNYGGRCAAHAELAKLVPPTTATSAAFSSYEARMYLQRNAETLMQQEYNKAVDGIMPCAPCHGNGASTAMPERYVFRCDGVSCSRQEVNPNGLGDGRKY